MDKEKKGVIWLIMFIIIILIALLAVGYYIYFFSNECGDKTCWETSMAKCARTFYTSESDNMLMSYSILGKSGESCKIKVKLLQVKSGAAELENLQDKTMICLTDLGVVIAPEQNLKMCSGLLKESIQEIIIKRMHSQIVENIGKISEEVTKVI